MQSLFLAYLDYCANVHATQGMADLIAVMGPAPYWIVCLVPAILILIGSAAVAVAFAFPFIALARLAYGAARKGG